MRRQTRVNVLCGALFGLLFSGWLLFYVYDGSHMEADDFAGFADAAKERLRDTADAARDKWRDTADAAMEKWRDTAEVAKDTWRALEEGYHGDGDQGAAVQTGLQQDDEDLEDDQVEYRTSVPELALTPAPRQSSDHRAKHREGGHKHSHHRQDSRHDKDQITDLESDQEPEDRETLREEPRPHQHHKTQHKPVAEVTTETPSTELAQEETVTTEEPEVTTEAVHKEHKHINKEGAPHPHKPAHRPKHHKHRTDTTKVSQAHNVSESTVSQPEAMQSTGGTAEKGGVTTTYVPEEDDTALLEELEEVPDRATQQQMVQTAQAQQTVYNAHVPAAVVPQQGPPILQPDPVQQQQAPLQGSSVLYQGQAAPQNVPVPAPSMHDAVPGVPGPAVVAPSQPVAPQSVPQPVGEPQIPTGPHETSLEDMIKLAKPLNITRKEERIDWERFFRFIPNGLQSCSDLFPNLADNNPLPSDFKKAYAEYEALLHSYKIEESHTGSHLEQFIVYYFLVRAPFVRTVCETGFGAGHSTFLWLQANPDVHVYSFDLGEHPYSRSVAEYLSQRYPGRLHVVWGDSVKTLPRVREANKEFRCDIVVIDGGHTFRESLSDYFHLRRMVRANNLVLLDNYPDISRDYMQSLGNVWEGGKRRGEIIEIFHCDYRPNPHGFSVGRFIQTPQT